MRTFSNGHARALHLHMRVHLVVLLAAPLCAQPVSLGGKIGVQFTDPMGPYGESRPFTFGPSVEVRLPASFALEASALYRRLGQTSVFYYAANPDLNTTLISRSRGNAWEFPLIGKYYFNRDARWQPYLGTGWSLQTIGWRHQGSTPTVNPSGGLTVVAFDYHDRSELNVGATAVAGVRLRVGRTSLLPEVRYTRWGQRGPRFSPSRQNDIGVYLGIRF